MFIPVTHFQPCQTNLELAQLQEFFCSENSVAVALPLRGECNLQR